jgi:hypothetical protein
MLIIIKKSREAEAYNAYTSEKEERMHRHETKKIILKCCDRKAPSAR